jgi:integrase
MPALIDQLTEAKIRSLKGPGMYPDGRGLYLQIRLGGARSWIFRFTIDGRTRDKGLGSLSSVGLVEARGKAAECRALRARGLDPINEEKALTSSAPVVPTRTFEQAAEEYMADRVKRLLNAKHREQWKSTITTYAYPVIGALDVANIDTPEIVQVLDPIWREKPETASRLRGRIERILARETVMQRRSGPNPAAWRGHLQEAFPAKSEIRPAVHHPAMKFTELPAFMVKLEKREGVSAAALKFLILTAARTGEVAGATWTEIDWEKGLWTIPAHRMKAGAVHIVPLSSGTMTVLNEMKALRDVNGFIFPGMRGKGLSQMAVLVLLQKRMGYADLTVHGFRSCFSDWAGDETEFDKQVREFALAHGISDKTEAAYRRSRAIVRRRELMQLWSDFCLSKLRNVAHKPEAALEPA